MSSHRSKKISSTTSNGITIIIVLACSLVSTVVLIFIYQHLCRKKRYSRGEYDSIGMNDHNEEDGGWTSYDPSVLDWDPEEARVKRRLNATEVKKKRLNKQVELLDQQLTARRRALDKVSDQSAQLTSRLESAREPTSMGSNIGHLPANSPALAAVDAKGRAMFGDKWTTGSNGEVPIRSILTLAPEELQQIKRGLETARDEARSSRGMQRGGGVSASSNSGGSGNGSNSNSTGMSETKALASLSGDHNYDNHTNLLARTSRLTDRLRAASGNTPRRR